MVTYGADTFYVGLESLKECKTGKKCKGQQWGCFFERLLSQSQPLGWNLNLHLDLPLLCPAEGVRDVGGARLSVWWFPQSNAWRFA